MRRRTNLILLALFPLLVLTACATNYQREGVFSNGYSDFRLKEDTFVVTYRANEHTSPEKVMQFALQRASELTVQNGYRYFAIVDQIDTSREHTVSKKQREGNSETKIVSHLHYPSLRLTIQCFQEKPLHVETIDAQRYLTYN